MWIEEMCRVRSPAFEKIRASSPATFCLELLDLSSQVSRQNVSASGEEIRLTTKAIWRRNEPTGQWGVPS